MPTYKRTLPEAAKLAAERGECVVPVWPGTKRTIGKWPTSRPGLEQLRRTWPKPGERRKVKVDDHFETWTVPEVCAVGILTELSGLVVIDCDSQEALDWVDSKTKIQTRRLYTSVTEDGFDKTHLIFSADKEYKTCAKPVINGRKSPIDIRARGGMEKIWDPTEDPPREFSDTPIAKLPARLAKILPLADSPSESLEDGSSDLDLDRFLREGIPEGSRNEDGFRLAQSQRNKGIPLDIWMSLIRFILDKSNATHREFPDSMLEGWWKSADKKVREEEAGYNDGDFQYLDMSQVGMPEPAKLSPGETSLATGINYIFGSAGDGKTRLVYWDVLQRIRNGETWALYDREMGAEAFREAMTQLGATEEEICSIRYIYPDVTPNLLKSGEVLTDQLIEDGIDGIVYDSLAVFLGAAGIGENDQTLVREWFDKACRPMKVSWVIDHTGHENADHGRGASAKADAVHFGLHLETITPFSEGVNGEIKLTATKIRRGKFQKGSWLLVDIKTHSGDHMDFDPNFWEPPRAASDSSDMTVAGIIEDIVRYREDKEVSATELQKHMTGQHKRTKLSRIKEAVDDGEIIERKINQKNIRYSVPEPS